MSSVAMHPHAAVQEVVESATATLLHVVQALVCEPERVKAEVASTAISDRYLLSLAVSPSDMVRVVGPEGRTAESLRAILNAMTRKAGQRIDLDIRAADTQK